MLTGTEKEEEEDDDDEKEGGEGPGGGRRRRHPQECPPHRFRMGLHAFPGGGLVEVLLVRHCCQARRKVPSA